MTTVTLRLRVYFMQSMHEVMLVNAAIFRFVGRCADNPDNPVELHRPLPIPTVFMKNALPIWIRSLLLVLLAAAWLAPANAQLATGGGAVVTTAQVRAELLAHAPQGIEPDQPLWLGLQIQHQPQWHTYWKNSGDSGKPTELRWTLPAGLQAGEIEWPVPHKIPVANMVNYGYDATVLLAVPVTVTPAFKPSPVGGDVEVRLHAEWLVCRKECIPESGDFLLRVPVRGSTALHGAAFDAAKAARPQSLTATAKDSVRVQGLQLLISIAGLPGAWQGKTLDFFPEVPEVIETAASWKQSWQGATWNAQVPVSAQRLNSPNLLPMVLTHGASGVRLEVKVSGKWPPVVDPLAGQATLASEPKAMPAASNASASGPAVMVDPPKMESSLPTRLPVTTPAVASGSLGLSLLGALLGGLILNLMPCVFPVLAIKLLSFSQHGADRHRQRISAVAYSLGVVLSFVALGALLLGLRAAGESLGWGFQLQNPWVVAALAGLFTLLGLNLAGVFEFGQILPSSVASLQARHPVVDAWLTGVLAVAIASPCTAPFMGASLGFAVGLPVHEALLVFATLGLGMALPYLAVALTPQLARVLPRPGAWMHTFRQLMAFPMFATVVWLVWVLGQQSGIDGASSLLALLVAMSALIWALGQSGKTRVWLSLVLAALLLWMVGAWGPMLAASAPVPATAATHGRWQPWSAARVQQAVAQGQPVFVDFTAAWCVTCQVNKRNTLSDADLLAEFERRKVLLLRADWTRYDAAITQALSELGRSGVPVYVLHRPGKSPLVLSELLSVAEVRAALEQI